MLTAGLTKERFYTILVTHKEGVECFKKAASLGSSQAEIALKQGMNRLTEEMFGNGIKLINSGKYLEAIDCFNDVIRVKPDHVNAWINKGAALDRLEKYSEAIECLNEALEINPENTHALYNKGIIIGKMGKTQAAAEWITKAANLGFEEATVFLERRRLGENTEKYFSTGVHYLKLNDPDVTGRVKWW